MRGMSTSKHSAFQSRLFYSLVAEMLKEVERELIEIKSVRFLCNYPWPPGKRLRPITFLLSNLSVRVEKPHNVYVNGRELAEAGLAELIELKELRLPEGANGSPHRGRSKTGSHA